MPPPAPPPLAERILRLAIRKDEWRDAVSGDLREEFGHILRQSGLAPARRWYWRQALGLGARFAVGRLVPAVEPRRWQPRDADLEPSRSWTVASDALHAWRAVRQRPGISATIVGTLAVALAANATIFSLADALYLRPFRFAGADRLLIVSSAPDNDPGADHSSVAAADFRDWERESTTLTSFAAAAFWDPNLSGIEDPEQVPGFRVSPRFFRTIGAEPLLGRTFADSEGTPGANRRVVLSHGLWIRRFGSDPAIVGRTLRFDGEPYEVVGVMRPGTALPYGADVWAPLDYSEQEWADRTRGGLLVMARLADGQEIGAARAEMAAIVERQRQAYPDTNAKRGSTVVTVTRGLSDGFAAPLLAIWQAAAILLLAIASANIANLLLAHGAERQQEFAVRLALGAGRWRIARQLLFEGAWRALAAVVVTIPLAMAGAEATRRSLPPGIHRWVPGIDFIRVDAATFDDHARTRRGRDAVLLVAARPASVKGGGVRYAAPGRANDGRERDPQLAGCRAGLGPGRARPGPGRRSGPGDRRRGSGGQRHARLRQAAADHRATEVNHVGVRERRAAPAVRRSGARAAARHPGGGDAGDLLVAPLYRGLRDAADLPRGSDPHRRRRSTGAVGEHFTRLPQGDAHSAARRPVIHRRGPGGHLSGHGGEPGVCGLVLAGRLAARAPLQDRRRRAVARGGGCFGATWSRTCSWIAGPRPTIGRLPSRRPSRRCSWPGPRRTRPILSGELRRAIAAADPDQPVLELRSMDQVVADRAGGITAFARLLAAMGAVALLLALVGIYSLMAYVASRRTREFGVRMALGATRWQVVRLSLRQAAIVTVCGLAVGTGLALALSRVMSSAMFGLVSIDVASIAMMTAALGATVMVAGWLPARRAARLVPTEALRTN